MSGLTLGAEARTMVWLRTRETLGESRRVGRLAVLPAVIIVWTALLTVGTIALADADMEVVAGSLPIIATGLWPLWAIVPLLGGGAGESTSAKRLSPYPVTPRALLIASSFSALLDFPVLFGFPLLVALLVAVAGPWGVLVAFAFLVGACSVGQLAAWSLVGAQASERSRLVLPVIVLASLLLALFANGSGVAGVLPGAWAEAAATGPPLQQVLGSLALAVPFGFLVLVGPRLVAYADDRARLHKSSREVVWRGPSKTPLLVLLVLDTLRSVLRSAIARAAIVGALAAPVVITLTLTGSNRLQASTLMAFVTLAAGASLMVNSFAFDGSGALLLLRAPIHRWVLVASRFLALLAVVLVLQVGVVLVAWILTGGSTIMHIDVWSAIGRAVVVVSLALLWSVRFPGPADVESLRGRLSPPLPTAGYLFTCALLTGPLDLARYALPTGSVSPLLVASGIALVCLSVVHASLGREAPARIAFANRS